MARRRAAWMRGAAMQWQEGLTVSHLAARALRTAGLGCSGRRRFGARRGAQRRRDGGGWARARRPLLGDDGRDGETDRVSGRGES
jgi:hypothetical protein